MNNIITKIRNLKIGLSLSGGRLKINSPAGVLTKEILDEIRDNREYITAYLNELAGKTRFFAVPKAELREYYPVSSAQKRLFFLHVMNRNSLWYNMPQICRMEGKIDRQRLLKAFNDLIARHEIFRTSFPVIGGVPVQKLEDQVPFSIEYCGEDEMPGQDGPDHFVRPFDLDRPPLLRVRVAGPDTPEPVLLIDTHHIVSDAVSLELLRQDFFELYGQKELPDLSLQYKDYSGWQNSKAQQKKNHEQTAWWVKELSGNPPLLDLPLDFPRPVTVGDQGGLAGMYLSGEEYACFSKFRDAHKLTTGMLLYSLTAILFSKLSGQEDLVIGLSIAGRNHPDLEGIVGMFVNALPLRCFPVNNKPVEQFVSEVRTSALSAYDHQDCQFDDLVEKLHIPRTMGRNPVFDVMLNMAKPVDSYIDLSGGGAGTDKQTSGPKRFDLTVNATGYRNTLFLQFQYDILLFRPETILKWLGYFRNIILSLDSAEVKLLSDLRIEKEETVRIVFDALKNYTDAATPGNGPAAAERAPASWHQERCWFIDKFESGYLYEAGPVYHTIPLLIDCKGEIDPATLERSALMTIQKYKILLTRIVSVQESLYQQVADGEELVVRYRRAEEGADTADLLAGEIAGAFALDGWLVRLTIWQTGEKEVKLVIGFHHSIADRYSVSRIAGEILSTYVSLRNGEATGHKDPPIQYAGYSRWQQLVLSGLETYLLSYWRLQLKGKLKALEFPTDRPRAAIHTYTGASAEFSLPRLLVGRLKAFEKEYRIGSGDFLMAVFILLLSEYCRQEEIVIGTSTDNRGEDLLEGLIGPVSNLLVIRNFVRPGCRFTEFVRQVRDTNQDALRYGSLPFDRLVKQLAPGEDMSRTALFDTFFEYREKAPVPASIEGTVFTVHETNYGYGKYDLNLLLEGNGSSITGKLVFNLDYFDRERIVSFIGHYHELIGNALSAPGNKLAELEYVSPAEKELLLDALDHTGVAYPEHRSVTGLFLDQVRKNPGAPAVQCGDRSLSYGELNKKAGILAGLLRKRGVRANEVVAFLTDRSVDTITGIMAILKSGAAYLPVDTDYPEERIGYLLRDSRAALLLTTAAVENPEKYGIPVIYIGEADDIEAGEEPDTDVEVSPSDLCYVIYTSGTTGDPKGVMVEHRNVVRLFFNEEFQFDFGPDDVWTMFHSHCFDFSVWEIFGALLFGGKLIVIPKIMAIDTRSYLELLRKEGVTVLNQTPSAFYSLIREEFSWLDTGLKLRYVIFGGESLSPRKLTGWKTKYPDTALINMFGITETTVHVTYKKITDKEISADQCNIGKPIPTLSCYVSDAAGRLVPRGIAGELYVGGMGVSRGYLGKEELTARKFLPDPRRPGGKLYRSGDLVRLLVSGDLEYIGRIDTQLKIRGFRVEAGEIEHRLSMHESIETSLVLAREREENKFLVAYYTSKDGVPVEGLSDYLHGHLPAHMVPERYVWLAYFPLTSNGKVDRGALPDPEADAGDDRSEPSDATEARLVEIWGEVLNLERERISTTRSFFEMGGHSLRAAMLAGKIHKELNIQLPLEKIFSLKTIRRIAGYLGALMGSGKEPGLETGLPGGFLPIVPALQKEYYPLSPAQKRLYFLHEFDKGSTAYNLPRSFWLEGLLDRERVTDAFRKVVARHESLRTFFEPVLGAPVQKIAGETDIPVESFSGHEEEVDEIIKRFVRPFDLRTAPLVRIGIIRIDRKGPTVTPERNILLVDMPHIISDGISHGILIRDFMEYYKGGNLPASLLQYKDFVEWQQSAEELRRVSIQKEYWLRLYSEELITPELPADFARPPIKSYEGARLYFEIDAPDTARLKQFAAAGEATLFMVVLAIYHILLSKLCNKDDLVVGVPVAGRQHADAEGITGMFVNTLPLRNCPGPGSTMREFLAAVRSGVLDAFANQDYPYEELIRELKIERDTSRNPLFDVLFIFENMEEERLEIPGLVCRPYGTGHAGSKFDLTLSAVVSGDRLSLNMEYSTALFREETIKRFIGYFRRIASVMAADAGTRIAEADILAGDEKDQILHGFNQTSTFWPRDKKIIDLFAEQVKRTPSNIAIRYKDREMTYLELQDRSDRIAAYIRDTGQIGEGELVGILLERDEDLVPVIFGILKCGAAYVPVDPRFPAGRINSILGDAGLRVLVTRGRYLQPLLDLPPVLIDLDLAAAAINASGRLQQPEDAGDTRLKEQPDGKGRGNSLAYVIYTSGSTGKPKGVMISHHSVINRILWMQKEYPIGEGDVLLQKTPVVFDVSVWELFWWSFTGASLCILEPDMEKDPGKMIGVIRANKVTTLHFIPPMLGAFLSGLHKENWKDLATLRLVFASGEALKPSQVNMFGETLHKNCNTRLINLYGPTETTVDSSFYECGFDRITQTVPIGKPISNTRLYILDRSERPEPVGVPGELCIAGAGLAIGYLNNPELTEKKFIRPAHLPEERIYRTGDLVKWLPDGNVAFLGRIDSQVKIRGFRIEMGDVEQRIIKFDGVCEALVIAKERKGDKYLVAYYVAGEEIGIGRLKNFLAAGLPDYMVPSFFVRLDSLPLTPTGKLNRKALPDPEIGRGDECTRPVNEVQKELVRIWADLLGMEAERIGTDMNFFDIGGDSLKLIEMVNRVNRQFKTVLSVSTMFRYPSISGLADHLKNAGQDVMGGDAEHRDGMEQMQDAFRLMDQIGE